jgi:hypothetical protein
MIKGRLLFSLGVTVALALPAPADAQWAAGLKSGFGQGAFTGPSEFEWQAEAITYSAFVNGPIRRALALQAEVYLTEKLGESSVAGSDLTMRADYIVVPLLARFSPALPGPIQPYLLAGPSLVVELRCRLRSTTPGVPTNESCDGRRGDLDAVDVGIEGGAGVELGVGPVKLLLEGRGATNAGTVTVPTGTSTSRGFAWSVLTGVSIPFRARTGARVRPDDRRPPSVPAAAANPADLPPLAPLPADALVERRAAPPRVENLGQRISVRAIDADARALLVGIAREAGINLVVSSDVRRRVSLTLIDVPAMQAIQEIAAAANLTITTPEDRVLPTVVYYQLPVNVNEASAETIAKRFDVSLELARFIVESRKP